MTQKANLNEALFEVAKTGNLKEVQSLIENGTDVNAVEEHGITPFLWAYFNGHKDVVKYLLAKGGDINHDKFSEGTLLTFAAFTGDIDFIPDLLDAGAEIDHAMPRGGETALHHAADNGKTAAVKLLIERGADVNHRTKHNGPSELNFGTFWGETPLHVAAVRGDAEMVEALLAAGADRTIQNAKRGTPFDQATRRERSAEILQLLGVETATDENRDVSYTDEKGRTRWHRNDEIAEKLQQLHDILVIGGYEESHAARYPRLAYAISRHPESIEILHQEDRLLEISGVGGTIAGIIGEFIETGTCTKLEEFAEHTPKTVLELTAVPKLGTKTAKMLYEELGIDSLASLKRALDEGTLKGVKGMGKKTLETIHQHINENLR